MAAVAAALMAIMVAATGCTDSEIRSTCRFEGDSVTIFGPEVDDEQRTLKHALSPWEQETCVTVQVTAHRDFEQRVDWMVDGGHPPDIAIFPQPGKVTDLVGQVVPLPRDLAEDVRESVAPSWLDPVTVDAQVLAVPIKVDLKSIVWYSPTAFAANGYVVPSTFDGFLELAERMVQDGNTPFCLGLGSEFATGWPLTDWIEEFILRRAGPEVYDSWWRHDIPFDDREVVAAATEAVALLSRPGYVAGGLQRSPARSFSEAGHGVLREECMMYRMANYYVSNLPEDTSIGREGDIDAFYLPGSEQYPRIALVGGTFAAAFSEEPAVIETLEYIAGIEFAGAHATGSPGGFLSPHVDVDPETYSSDIDRRFAQWLTRADPMRFDASDLMPGAVGSGAFWEASVDIATGEETVAEAFTAIEENWPTTSS